MSKCVCDAEGNGWAKRHVTTLQEGNEVTICCSCCEREWTVTKEQAQSLRRDAKLDHL
jgi:hypothetical protein